MGGTGCAPDGTGAIGDDCVSDEQSDSCAAGGLCVSGVCRTICYLVSDSCCTGFTCSSYPDLFTDDVDSTTGVRDATCDPVSQECPEDGQGCYLSLRNGKATCVRIAAGAEALEQGDTCLHNDMNLCFLNGCAEGYGAFLYAGMNMPRDCSAFCSPVDTYLDDPDGDGEGAVVATADPDGAAPHDCAEGTIGVPGHQCRFFQSYFIDMNNMFLEYVPAAYGFCTPTTIDFGDCNRYSEEWFLESYNDFIEGGGTPEGWGDHITPLCGERVGGCPFGCMKLATKDALDEAYCAVAANATRPACVENLRGARVVRRSLERYWAARWLRD
jgi:hypothetical protein